MRFNTPPTAASRDPASPEYICPEQAQYMARREVVRHGARAAYARLGLVATADEEA